MDCLKDYIGVRKYGNPTPCESGLYINDLPILLEPLTGAKECDEFLMLWQIVQARASRIMAVAFYNLMSKRYTLKTNIDSYKLPTDIISLTEYPPVKGELRGIYVDCFIMKSAFAHVPLSSLGLYLNEAKVVDLKIFEVHDDDLTLLDTVTIKGVVGWNSLEINKNYFDSRTLFIAYDASDITSPSIPMEDINGVNHFYYNDLSHMFSHIFITGALYNDGHFQATSDDTFGITLKIAPIPTFEAIIANYKINLAVAWWYLLGCELMKERIYTDRVDRFIGADLPTARKLNQALHKDFMNEITTFVDSIDLSKEYFVETVLDKK